VPGALPPEGGSNAREEAIPELRRQADLADRPRDSVDVVWDPADLEGTARGVEETPGGPRVPVPRLPDAPRVHEKAGTEGAAHPTAELAWGLIISCLRKIPFENAGLRRGGRWQNSVGGDLNGKRLGVIGLGRLGSRVARVGKAFEMNVLAWSKHLTRERCIAAGAELAPSLDDVLRTSDIVTIHLVLSERTRGLIGARELGLMKSTAYLINTSRGPIVDERALIAALQQGKIAGAGLDVFDEEPLPAAHPFRTLENVVATPHLGYVSDDTYRIFYGQALEDVIAWMSGKPMRVLNPAK